jgi:hypothetical protein
MNTGTPLSCYNSCENKINSNVRENIHDKYMPDRGLRFKIIHWLVYLSAVGAISFTA